MSESSTDAPVAAKTQTPDASTVQLVSQLSDQVSRLIRDELALARAELTRKGKLAALGGGLFGGAGLIGFFAVATLVSCAVLGLATVLAAWLAALIIGLALVAAAGALALIGKKEISAATPPVPAEAIDGVQRDVRTIKEARAR